MASIAIALAFGIAAVTHASEPLRVLFVGNSQIYTANLPAVFQTVASASGRPVTTEMLVKGGATLTDRLVDGSVERALRTARYDWVVLQERGGDALCHGPGRDRCDAASAALTALATTIRHAAARPLLLGTYQPDAAVSRRLEQAEAALAAAARMPYVPLSEALRHGADSAPNLRWFAEDGMHPGPDLALLAALLLHDEILGEIGELGELRLSEPGYSPRARFFPPLLASERSDPRGEAPSPRYPVETTLQIRAIARHAQR